MRNTKWIYQNYQYYPQEKGEVIHPIVYSIMKERNLSYRKEFTSNPFLLEDMDKAVHLLQEAKKKGQTVWIYGDYDVDGITSVSLCYLALTELGYPVEYYIPLRDEGYGLNQEALQYIYEQGGRIVITVDCGIVSVKEVDFANSLGMTMIITDHHEIQGELPKAAAVINPKREENLYPFPSLAGVGTAFFLVTALFEQEEKREEIQKYFDIVALGTVADIVPLIEDNRILVQQGLALLAKSQWTGLRILVKRLFPDYETRRFSAYDIGFILAPIFNAAGRLEDAKSSVKLFLEKDSKKANAQIDYLIQNNVERRGVQEKILQACLEEIQQKKLEEKNALVIAREGFHHGVIGIVASKLVDRFYKPSVVMEIKPEEGIATASCRSISGINIVEALGEISPLFLRYGGHSGAAGFSILIENISTFYEEFEKVLSRKVTEELLTKKLSITKELLPFQIQYPLLHDMRYLEPFGANNPSPIFALKHCRLDKIRLIGADKKHLMCNIQHGDTVFWNCVWFQASDVYEKLLFAKEVDIAFHLKLEMYRGRYQYKIFIEDIQISKQEKEKKYHLEEIEYSHISFPYEIILYLKHTNLSENLYLNFEEKEVRLFSNRSYLCYLDSNTSKILHYWNKEKTCEFQVRKKEIFLEEEHYRIHLEIVKKQKFQSYSLKEGLIFQDIKNFLLGKEGKYNRIQANILASFFKQKQNTLAIIERGRGVQTVLKTIVLFAKSQQQKYQILEEWDGRETIQENCSFLVFLFPKSIEKIPSFSFSCRVLILSEKNISLQGYYKIRDEYRIPKSVHWIPEEEISQHERVFSHRISQEKQKKILEELPFLQGLYATKDLLVHL